MLWFPPLSSHCCCAVNQWNVCLPAPSLQTRLIQAMATTLRMLVVSRARKGGKCGMWDSWNVKDYPWEHSQQGSQVCGSTNPCGSQCECTWELQPLRMGSWLDPSWHCKFWGAWNTIVHNPALGSFQQQNAGSTSLADVNCCVNEPRLSWAGLSHQTPTHLDFGSSWDILCSTKGDNSTEGIGLFWNMMLFSSPIARVCQQTHPLLWLPITGFSWAVHVTRKVPGDLRAPELPRYSVSGRSPAPDQSVYPHPLSQALIKRPFYHFFPTCNNKKQSPSSSLIFSL